jgi:hypothetical protein
MMHIISGLALRTATSGRTFAVDDPEALNREGST